MVLFRRLFYSVNEGDAMLYQTMENEVFDLNSLPKSHETLYQGIKKLFLSGVNSSELWNFFCPEGRRLKISKTDPIFRILQDLSARIYIRSQFARLSHWYEDLDRFIKRKFKTRREFCRLTGVDEGHLSRVLAGKSRFSIDTLERILTKADVRIVFMDVDTSKTGEK